MENQRIWVPTRRWWAERKEGLALLAIRRRALLTALASALACRSSTR